jgi:exoribonuclease II
MVLSARVSARVVFLERALYRFVCAANTVRNVFYRVVNRLKEAIVVIVDVCAKKFFFFVVKKVLVVSVAGAHSHYATGVELAHFCGI